MNAKIQLFAHAIAVAEGYYVPGSIPQVRRNPGDIKSDGKTITTFNTDSDGWAKLYGLVTSAFLGTSHFYNPTMTISQMAKVYTGEAAYMNWAKIVANTLGVSPDTTLLGYLAS